MRIEAKAYNLLLMALKRVLHLSRVRVPNLSRLIEAARHNQVTKRIIKGHGVHHILVLLQTKQLSARLRIPDAASSIVTTRDELISRLVEGAISQWKKMSAQDRK